MIQLIFIALASLFSVSQSAAAKLYTKENNGASTLSFNLVKSGAAFLLFAIISAYSFKWHTPTLIYATLYGIGMLFSMLCGYLALMKGPMALTSLIVSYSVIIPCFFGIFYWNETLSTFRLCGLVLLCVSILLLRKKDAATIFKKNWLLYTTLTFVCNGVCSVIQKFHQTAYPGEYCNEFTVCNLAFTFVIFVAAVIAKKVSEKRENNEENGEKKSEKKKEKIKFPALAGICMGIASYLTLVLSAQENASVLFPLITVSTMIVNYIVSRLLFKERLSLVQLGGIMLGIASIVLLKL